MAGSLLGYVVKLSVLGNAILFVLLAGGSDASTAPQVYPHKPVHLRYDLSPELNQEPYWGEIFDAQQAWDDAMKDGADIITNHGAVLGPFDAIIVNGEEGEDLPVSLWAHSNQQATRTVTVPNCNASVASFTESASGVDQVMKVMVLNTACYLDIGSGLRWRSLTHELGHVVGLGDHGNPYDGIMDQGVDTFPGDFQILNFPVANFPNNPLLELFPDEASCVRLLFDIPGKQLCAPE